MRLIQTVISVAMLATSMVSPVNARPTDDPDMVTIIPGNASANLCTASLTYHNHEPVYGSLTLMSPDFNNFKLINIDQDTIDVKDKFLPQGNMHITRGKDIHGFSLTYAGNTTKAPTKLAGSTTYSDRSYCQTSPGDLWMCDLYFACPGTSKLADNEKLDDETTQIYEDD